MGTTDPVTTDTRRLSIRLPRPLWIGLATVVLAVGAFGFLSELAEPATASGNQPDPTRVEHVSVWWPKGQGGSLGTVRYRPSQKEQPFFNRLPADEVVTGSHDGRYEISTKDKTYVGWFGIVREIDEDAAANRTVLTVEHKYFDGLTDAHLQAVSFNGSGDFRVTLTGVGHRIPPLSLVKVYGTVAAGKPGSLARIDPDFVRDWHWGTFTFLAAYGAQHGSDKWRKANQVPLDEIYEAWPHPCYHYYEERLGKRPDTPAIRRRLVDAAGQLSPEARQAMERLADLLSVGHSWSQSETVRQSREFSQIVQLVKTTAAKKAAINLLVQALHENDERVSSSATEKFAELDRDRDAVGTLVNLLDNEDQRVRAGAARALWHGYGAKAAPAVAALSRCVVETDNDLRQYAILALGEIGPAARGAVPTLRNALTDEDLEIRVDAAKVLWSIDRQPEDVISVMVAVLENGDEGQQHAAADQLKDMGPWAAPAVPALIKSLKDESWTTRCGVIRALGEIGPAAVHAIPALAEILAHDEHSIVQSNAAESLGKIRDPQAIPFLIGALENEDDHVRWTAINALENFGHTAQSAVPAVIRAIKSDDANGWIAASVLGAIDGEGVGVPVLIDALGSKNSNVRRFAAFGLRRIGRKAAAAEKALHDGLRDSDPGVRIAAAEAYWSVSGKADEPVRVLRAVLQPAGTWIIQMGAANALAEIGPAAKAAVPELIACLASDTRYVVTSSAKALGRIGPAAASAVPALTAQLEKSDDKYTRVCLARALWRINRSERTLPVMEDALTNSRDFMALSEAAEAIGEMGHQAAAAVPLLQPFVKDSSSHVRDAAAEALKHLERN